MHQRRLSTDLRLTEEFDSSDPDNIEPEARYVQIQPGRRQVRQRGLFRVSGKWGRGNGLRQGLT